MNAELNYLELYAPLSLQISSQLLVQNTVCWTHYLSRTDSFYNRALISPLLVSPGTGAPVEVKADPERRIASQNNGVLGLWSQASQR